MAEVDRQLVQRIADEVLAALNGPASTPADNVAQIHPPIGECTGDYSKFEELRGKRVGAPAPHDNVPKPEATVEETSALKGFVTAEQLRTAIATSKDGVAVLAADARLTPLANDLVREMKAQVRRVGNIGKGKATSDDVTWLWWADGFCPSVQNLTSDLRGTLLPITGERSITGLAAVIRDLAKRVKEERVVGGVLFVKSGALAMCYANRCRSLRAVLGTCDESVDQGLRDLAANVLVVEYPHTNGDKMRSMVQRFTRAAPKPHLPIERELRELGECG